jgi:integrase
MATVKFITRGGNDNVSIYVRFVISKSKDFTRKTGLLIDASKWSIKKGRPVDNKDQSTKELKSKLDKLAVFINDAYNTSVSKGEDLSGEWLQLQIDLFNNKVQVVALDVLTTYIDKYISEAPYKQNNKKQLGLSKGRIQNIKLFKATILRYEASVFKGKSILIKDINLQFAEKFKMWLFNLNYSVNYVGKNIANLKTICIDAKKNDIETSTQILNIKGISEQKQTEEIIYLSEEEQSQIANAPIIREALNNARKWLLLGCLLGQRGGDLLNITAKNIKEMNGIKIIELKQQKTGKLVAIPLLPGALSIIESGLPYKISLEKFNVYIKEVCQCANLNQLTIGRKKPTGRNPTIKGSHPKWELISSHVCRRSFATNFYARIPTPVLMNITAHGTERMFLSYIGKTTYDNVYQMLEYFSKLVPKEITPPQMEVIRNNNL